MIHYLGGNGTSQSQAIKIMGADSEVDGVDAEYVMITRIYEILQLKWEVLGQELFEIGAHYYDRLTVFDENSVVSEIWFDVTEFFGK